jgi:large subunit ribosomal protein L7/L12
MDENKTLRMKYDVLLLDAGDNKIQMMRLIMDITGWGLKQSKDLLDRPPGVVAEALPHSEAREIMERLEAAGAQAEVRRRLKR